MQTHNNYSFGLNKKKPTKQPKREIHEDVSEEDPFEHLTNMFKPQSSMDRDKNHIYFYQSVDQQSCLELNRKINDLNKDLMQHAIEYEIEPPNIYLHINSFGGSLFAAFATIDTIINSKIPIVSIIEGCAASAATIISMVCHKRYCTQNSFMLIHQLSTGASGKYEEMKDDFMNDTKLMELLYKLYLEHTSMDIKTIKKVLKRDLWWDATKCLKHGLIDDIWNGSKIDLNVHKEFGTEHFSTVKVNENHKRKRNVVSTDDLKVLNVLNDSDDSDDSESDSEETNKVSKSKRSKTIKSTKADKTDKAAKSTEDNSDDEDNTELKPKRPKRKFKNKD